MSQVFHEHLPVRQARRIKRLHRFKFHRVTRLWMGIVALPWLLLSCTPNEAKTLLALADACNGQGVANAADYDPKSSELPTVAGLISDKNKNIQWGDNRYVSGSLKQAKVAKNAQLVLCVDLQPRKALETCRYSGAVSADIPRTQRSAVVRLVVAKTGQVLKKEQITAAIDRCPFSISSVPPDDSWDLDKPTVRYNEFTADHPLRDKIGKWSFQVLDRSSPQPPKP